MERYLDVAAGVRVRAERIEATGPHPGEPLLLVMDAGCSALVWPDALVARLAEHHPVLRYDHRDTGRSTWSSDDGEPYGTADLAADALAVLDAFDVPRAHLVGTGLGGAIAQLLLLDHPERFATATVLCTAALPSPGGPQLLGPDPALLRLWAELDDPRDEEGELAWRVEQWRLLNGAGIPFDADEFRALERRVVAHAGRWEPSAAHRRLDDRGTHRGAELAGVRVPVLVVEAPEDPVHPPPHSGHLSRALGNGRLVRVTGMGHAISRAVVAPLADAILSQTALVDAAPHA